jgi:hypothetical protein
MSTVAFSGQFIWRFLENDIFEFCLACYAIGF